MSAARYFLDESGHSGDAADVGEAFDFGNQPIFALACIGVADEAELGEALQRLRLKHRFQGAELKARSLKGKLPAFALDLLEILAERGCPIFVEVTDKRFFLCVHIVDRLLGADGSGVQADATSRNAMAEYIRNGAPDAVLRAYADACTAPSPKAVQFAIAALAGWLEPQTTDEMGRLLQQVTRLAAKRAAALEIDPLEFLPLFDTGPHGKPVWMLPNLQCFTNIYARLNQSLDCDMDEVELVHDEQRQYGPILCDAKALMETMGDQAPLMPFADYRLRGMARLRFTTSSEEPCIQAADILAGFVMRYVKDGLAAPDAILESDRRAFLTLLSTADPVQTTGINLVMTKRDLDRLAIPTVRSWI